MKTLSLFPLLFCFVITIAFSVSAQSDVEVERLAAQGVKAYNENNFIDAEKLFLQAIALEDKKQVPSIRRNSTNYIYLSNIYTHVKKDRAKGDATIEKYLLFDKSSALAYRLYATTILGPQSKLDQTAIDYLTEAILLEPNNPENYYHRARGMAAKFPGMAISDLDRAIKADPKFALAYEDRAQLHFKQGDYTAAAADYEKFYQLRPNEEATYLVWHGMAVLFKGDTNAAIADFTKLINNSNSSNSSDRSIAYYYRGYANLLNWNRAAAQADMIEAGKLDPKKKTMWYARLAMEPEEKCRSAKKTTDDIDDLYKDRKYTSANNSEFRYQLFKLRANLAICEPNSPSAVFKLIYRNPTDDLNIDHAHLQKYMRTLAPTDAQRDPNLPESLREMNIRLGIDPKAHLIQSTDPNWKYIALRDQTTSIYPYKTAAENIAAAQKAIAEGRHHYAIALLNHLLETEPANIPAQEERIRAFVNKGARLRAFDEAQKILKVYPNSFVALNVRGMVNDFAGRGDAALADYTAAIAANPKFDRAYFNRGQYYLIRNKADLALKDFTQAVNLAKENGLYLTHRGHANYALKEYKAAERDYLVVVTIDPSNYEARLGLINSFDRDGDPASKKLADFHHSWLIQNASDYTGLKTIAGRNPQLESSATLAIARSKAVDDLVFYSDKMTDGYEDYKKADERYRRENVKKEQLIGWLNTDLKNLAIIIKDADKLESEAKRILADTSLKLSASDTSKVRTFLQNAVLVRGFCREHITETKGSLSKLGIN